MENSVESKLKNNIDEKLQNNIETVDALFHDDTDIVKREFVFHAKKDIQGIMYYTDGLVDAQLIDRNIIKPLTIYGNMLKEALHIPASRKAEHLVRHLLQSSSIKIIDTYDKGIDGMLSGETLLFLDGYKQAFAINTRGWKSRGVEEPQVEAVVRGPRDGFTESIRVNTAAVRRRIRDPRLNIEAVRIGTKSKTDVNIAYLQGTVKAGLVKEVKRRLERIQIDGILESGYIQELITDAPMSPFPTIQSTERPDKVAAAILEGRVAIFVDNTPFVLIAPTYFWQYLQASDDYYSNFYVSSFFRFIRYVAFLVSLTLPSLYVMLVSFHQEMIPTPLALTIAAGREIVPIPVLMEALLLELAFELMREAGLRLPKPVGQAVSIVGSLIVGQAAVQAGIVSPFMVIIVAATGIASFAVPNYAASFAIRLLRFPLLLASGFLGLLGFATLITLYLIHVISLRSFGEPYFAPVVPLRPTEQKDWIFRFPMWSMKHNTLMAQGRSGQRANNPKPAPPRRQGSKGWLKRLFKNRGNPK